CGFGTEERQLLLDGLELAERSAELFALQHVPHRAFESRLQGASDLRGASQCCVVEQALSFTAARWRSLDRSVGELQVVTRLVSQIHPLVHARISNSHNDDVRLSVEGHCRDDAGNIAAPRNTR